MSKTLFSSLLCMICLPLVGAAEFPEAVKTAEVLMQQKKYGDVIEILKETVPNEFRNYAFWLKTLAYYQNKDNETALSLCRQAIKENGENPWLPKIRFLAADILLQQKNYNEAEAIYAEEAARLLSEDRKEDIAGIYISFAEKLSYKPGPEELEKSQPDFDRALKFYYEALKLGISDSLREEVLFKIATLQKIAERYNNAVTDYIKYLVEFDPAWKQTGSSTIIKKPGKTEHILDARFNLGESYLKTSYVNKARIVFRDLIKISGNTEYKRLALRRIPFTYKFPSPGSDFDLDNGVEATLGFIKAYPGDPIAPTLAWNMASAYLYRGQSSKGIEALMDFIAKKNFKITVNETAKEMEERERIGITQLPAEQYDIFRKEAYYKLGQLYLGLKNYKAAKKNYSEYISRFPNGPRWTEAQQGIINIEFKEGVDLIENKKYPEAEEKWNAFLLKYPLDFRCRQVLFTLAQIFYEEGKELKEKKTTGSTGAFRKAVTGYKKVVSKYPGTDEAFLAQLRIGEIREYEFKEFKAALKNYKAITHGSHYTEALERINRMVNRELIIRTGRIFRTTEKALVKLQGRNVEKVKLNIYKLNLEAYFRKAHSVKGIENLDLALIQPDSSWEVKIEGYEKYLPIEQQIEIPMEGAGVYAVNIASDDLEATTLVIRSDVDIIVKSSKKEFLVFVQDMVKSRPVAGANIIATDGSKVLVEEISGDDGVFTKKLEELSSIDNLNVFVSVDGNIGATGLDIRNLSFSKGLIPKGYIYTGKPAYKPGEVVNIRGILRDVNEGSYIVPGIREKDEYNLSVSDTTGRKIYQEKIELSSFGTFTAAFQLNNQAPTGNYSIRVEKKNSVFNSVFRVADYKLEKIKLSLDFEQDIYFRGEMIKGSFKAEYYFGQPVTDHEIVYNTPDGVSHRENTGSDGTLSFEFDTTPYNDGTTLSFSGNLAGENVSTQKAIFLAGRGFTIALSSAREVSLEGEPVEINVVTKDITGKPLAREIEISAYLRITEKQNPVIGSVPFLNQEMSLYFEQPVEKKTVRTDEWGRTTALFILKEGGQYIFRASGKDRFNNVISASTQHFVSGKEDETKLRIFAGKQHFKVAESGPIILHSRLESKTLALITFEGEGIISYKTVLLKPGKNDLQLQTGHNHFPNFTVNVAAMDKNRFYSASLPFTVERELKIKITGEKRIFEPGGQQEIEVTVTDHTGAPITAELSLTLVNSSLLAQYPDLTQNIVSFFQEGAWREGVMKTETSCTFYYAPRTKEVLKEFKDEEERLIEQKEEAGYADFYADEEEMEYDESPSEILSNEDIDNLLRAEGSSSDKRKRSEKIAQAAEFSPDIANEPMILTENEKEIELPRERKEMETTGYWIGSIITGEDGKAAATIDLPENTGSFRIRFKGCTSETLVGETETLITIRKDFFVSLKVPALLQENDQPELVGRIHNLTGYKGPVDGVLKLIVAGHTINLLAKQVEMAANQTKEVIFDRFTVPKGDTMEIVFEVTAGEKYSDKIAKTIPLRRWGLPFSVGKSGVSENDTTLLLKLPGNKAYSSMNLNITLEPAVDHSIAGLILDNPYKPVIYEDVYCFPSPPSTTLIAAVSLLENMGTIKNSVVLHEKLYKQAAGLITELVSTQENSGNWLWDLETTEFAVTTSAYRALTAAEKAGFIVDKESITKARDFLKNSYSSISQDDNETKAILLHALSATGDADYSFVNRLYRNRNQLSDIALAFTALTLSHSDKKEMGRELLEILSTRAIKPENPATPGTFWSGENNGTWYHNSIETTAVALLAYQEIDPGNRLIREGIEYLLSEMKSYGFYPQKVTGLAVAALSVFYGRTVPSDSDYSVEVVINDKSMGSLTSSGKTIPGPLFINMPAGLILDGENRIQFKHSGSGQYLYRATLTGFSSDMTDPRSWNYPGFNYRKYIHQPLTYKGRLISESSMEIEQLESNRITNVKIDFNSGSRNSYMILEEHIPAGTVVLMDTIQGSHNKVELTKGKLRFFYEPKKYLSTLNYSLAAYCPGEYKVLPPVLRDAFSPGEMRVGSAKKLILLKPGDTSSEEYIMNENELYDLGKRYFDDGIYKTALNFLEQLYEKNPEKRQPDVARMLLWIRTEPEYFFANKVVEYFEILKEKYPDLSIPFKKILTVGNAYHEIGEFERAYLVYRATIEASFYKDSAVAGYLEKNNQFIGSVEYITRLMNEYPDLNSVITTWFSISQEIYTRSTELEKPLVNISILDDKEESREYKARDLLVFSENMLNRFMTFYTNHKLVDDAAFSMLNISLDKKEYRKTISNSKNYQLTYRESDFFSKYQYMEALAQFSLRRFDNAIETAREVAGGESDNKDLATYILGQIHHARREPGKAIDYYRDIEGQFPDAKEAIDYFEKRAILLPEINIFVPGNKIELKLEYRNIKEAYFQIYKVDLMKLYLREKNLSKITKINLAGISPFLEENVLLGEGKDYADKEKIVNLALGDEGAYLVVCRGDDIFTSGLILITPLTVEIQEDVTSGRIRVNIFDKEREIYPDNVHIKVIGSENTRFISGNTDLRGIFVADGIQGYPTVIARNNESQYAFYRGQNRIGAVSTPSGTTDKYDEDDFDRKYRGNLYKEQKMIQTKNRANLDFLYDQEIEGVEVQMAK